MIEEDGLQANSQRVGDVFLREMLTLRDEFEIVGDVRGRGLMLGMEMVKNKVTPLLIISSTCGHVFKAAPLWDIVHAQNSCNSRSQGSTCSTVLPLFCCQRMQSKCTGLSWALHILLVYMKACTGVHTEESPK